MRITAFQGSRLLALGSGLDFGDREIEIGTWAVGRGCRGHGVELRRFRVQGFGVQVLLQFRDLKFSDLGFRILEFRFYGFAFGVQGFRL